MLTPELLSVPSVRVKRETADFRMKLPRIGVLSRMRSKARRLLSVLAAAAGCPPRRDRGSPDTHREFSMRSARPSSFAVTLALASLVIFAAAPVAAQDDGDDPRSGFWLSGGLGGGIDSGGRGVVAGHVRLGETLGPHVLLGGDVTVWGQQRMSPIGRRTRTAWNLGGTFRIYPEADWGLYLRAGTGLTLAHASLENGSFLETNAIGLSFGLGAGHDVRIGDGGLVLTPGIDLLAIVFGSGGEALALFTVGVGFR